MKLFIGRALALRTLLALILLILSSNAGSSQSDGPAQEGALYLPRMANQNELPAAPAEAGSRPNIVFIITDDQPFHMQQFLPETNRLIGDQGITFLRAFAQDPLCCPSRTTVLKGQYTRTHNNISNIWPYGGAEVWNLRGGDQSTLATWLQGTGYRTGLFGKYMNATKALHPTIPPGWNDWYVFLNEEGDDPPTGPVESDGIDGEGYFNYYLTDNGTRRTFLDAPQDYGTDVITRRAVNFIRGTPASQPVFVYFAPRAPHKPAIPAPQDDGTMASIPAYRPPNYNEADVSDKPAWIRSQPSLSSAKRAELDALYVDMAESLQAVDRAVVAIVNELARTGRLDNTVLIFTSDHGFMLGEHRFHSWKECIYEECIRVPLLVRAPGVAPRRDYHLISLADIAPTLAELAGITPPIPVDGMSFAPLLHNRKAPWRDMLLIESLGYDPRRGRNAHAIRTSDYLYAELQTGEVELYDMHADPYQLVNRAGDPAFAAVVNDMKNRLNSFKFATDLALTQQASATTVAPGATVIYTLRVRNNGPRAAHSITVEYALPSTLAFVSCAAPGGVCHGQGNNRSVRFLYLAANETKTITLEAQVKPTVASGTTIRNTARVTALTSTDPAPGNDAATASITVKQAAPGDVIFADGFEQGNLAAWSSYYADGGDLSVRAAAALVQSWGVQVLIDDNVAIGVRDERPASEKHYHARFYFDPNSVAMAAHDSHVIFFGYSGTNLERPVLRVEFRFFGGNYQVRAALFSDGTTWRSGSWVNIADAPHIMELEWHAASAAGANDGGLTFWVDGVQRTHFAGMDNDTRRIDRVRLGSIAGIDAGTRGRVYFDAFESRRDSYIGAAAGAAIAASDSAPDAAEVAAFTETDETVDPAEIALIQEVLAQDAADRAGNGEGYELFLPRWSE